MSRVEYLNKMEEVETWRKQVSSNFDDSISESETMPPTKRAGPSAALPARDDDADLKADAMKLALSFKSDGNAKTGTKLMDIHHMFTHTFGIPKFAEEEKRCHHCQQRKFSTYEKYKITIINQVDNDGLPETFQFVDKVIPSPNVPLTDEEFLASCECEGELCFNNSCSCLADIDDVNMPGLKKNAYHGSGQLRSAYLNGHFPIYECGPKCKCGERCPNRVVQRGRTVPLTIFKTDNGRGWGVKAGGPIKKGNFVDCYFGELLTPNEAQSRRDEAVSSQQKDVYLFALDKFTNKNAADPRLHVPFEIDGEFMSGPTRFINHCCEPNLRILAVVKHLADQPFHSLAFFALEDIDRDTELTFDYLDGVLSNEDFKMKEKKSCLCAAERCRGYLF